MVGLLIFAAVVDVIRPPNLLLRRWPFNGLLINCRLKPPVVMVAATGPPERKRSAPTTCKYGRKLDSPPPLLPPCLSLPLLCAKKLISLSSRSRSRSRSRSDCFCVRRLTSPTCFHVTAAHRIISKTRFNKQTNQRIVFLTYARGRVRIELCVSVRNHEKDITTKKKAEAKEENRRAFH